MQSPNSLSPDRLSGEQRLAEISELLSSAIIRFKKASPISLNTSDSDGQLLRDNKAQQSVHSQRFSAAVNKYIDG